MLITFLLKDDHVKGGSSFVLVFSQNIFKAIFNKCILVFKDFYMGIPKYFFNFLFQDNLEYIV